MDLTNIVKHEFKSFLSLFLTLYSLLIINFPNEADIATPAIKIVEAR